MTELKVLFTQKGKEFIASFMAMCVIGISGVIMAFSYFIMATIQTGLEAINCEFGVESALGIDTCQDLFEFAIYPILDLKVIFIWASYFMIFGIIFGLFYMGFRARKHPVLLPIHIVSSVILGYGAIELSNIYRTVISNELLYEILVPFVIYNKIMLYFPQVIFFVIFVSGLIGFVGVFKGINQYNQGSENLQ